MKANELRVTNFVQFKNLNIVPVIFIGYDSVVLITPNGATMTAKLDEINPIPITEEWLIKFGFTDYRTLPYKTTKKAFYDIKAGVYLDYSGKYRNTKFRILYIPKTNTFRVVSPANNSITLRYIHQLQNLYYALTEKELEMK